MTPILHVEDLSIGFGQAPVVEGVGFSLERGRILGLVGESGSGKSLTARALLGLLPAGGRVLSGRVELDGVVISGLAEARMRELRGRRMAMLFQDSLGSLNPLHRIGRQIGEGLALRRGWRPSRVRERVAELLRQVGMQDAPRYMNAFPHQLSGGQRQRAMLALALADEPDVLIADEPTTALDAAVQRQVLDALLALRGSLSIVLISHDLPMMRSVADSVCVMRRGRIVEEGATRQVFAMPRHPYTRMLLDAEPCEPPDPVAPDAPEVLAAQGLAVRYPLGGTWPGRPARWLEAVRGVSFCLRQGECLGVVGESGSGKSSLGQALLRLIPASGRVVFGGEDILALPEARLRPLRAGLQVVFQDPLASLNPRFSVLECVAEGLGTRPSSPATQARVVDALGEVELPADLLHRYPHELSGGQCQRVCIARALVMRPRCIVFDEPTSSLDRNTQFQVVALLRALQLRHGLSSIFITHDLALVRRLCHRVLIMHDGRVVESGPTGAIFSAPEHEHTRTLLRAALPG
jgi:microcin C transport system ATP-binding protein